MNQSLILSTSFYREDKSKGTSPPSIPKYGTVSSINIQKLINSANNVRNYWETHKLPNDQVLISVKQTRVIPKTRRITKIIPKAEEKIKGVRYVYDDNDPTLKKHLFTYLITRQDLDRLIKRMGEVKDTIEKCFGGLLTFELFEKIKQERKKVNGIPYSSFLAWAADLLSVEEFTVLTTKDLIKNTRDENILVTFFDIGEKLDTFLKSHQLELDLSSQWDSNTFLVNKSQAQIIADKIPFLVSMELTDIHSLTSLPDSQSEPAAHRVLSIKDPTDEPIVGVLDTHFSEELYFSKWVEYHNETPEIQLKDEDYLHGTAVTGLIVDGPSFNPKLDDGCGNFRVRHFGISCSGPTSVLSLMRKIRDIVRSNPDIKVWNLSLGSEMEIEEFSISPGAALIDQLQNEYDVVFVIAATNMPNGKKAPYRIGAPADSLCSLVVGSVNDFGEPYSGSRQGPVLSFYYKPDLAARGGEKPISINKETRLLLPSRNGARYSYGTSYAAPWITRKMAYLIHVMKLTKEAAKALLIDAAAGWDKPNRWTDKIGFGEVPIRIEDILQSEDDEIKFIIQGVSRNYVTYTHTLPVPVAADKFPFKARATLCYMPRSERTHGVEYSLDELNLKIGPMKKEIVKDETGNAVEEKIVIAPLNNDYQHEESHAIKEDEARTSYRKWDNIKHLSEKLTNFSRSSFNGQWGIQVKAIRRGSDYEKHPLPFAMVVVLKEVKGKNRISQFISQCEQSGRWTVQPLDIRESVILRKKAQLALFDDLS